MYDVVVVGSGPAGLAAAAFCIRKGIDYRLIAGKLGGKSSLSVNFPDMNEYHILKAKEQVHVFRAQIEYLSHTWHDGYAEEVLDLDEHFVVRLRGSEEEIRARYLIAATGARAATLGIPGETELYGRALGSSAISYSHMLRDRTVCIIGDSDRAIDAAIECAQQAVEVFLVMMPHASYSHSALSFADERQEITILNGYSIIAFGGDEWTRTVRIRRGDQSTDQTREEEIEADAFFVERKVHPNTTLFADRVQTDADGAIVIDRDGHTSHPRIFAAGDVSSHGAEQILIALGDGTRAALCAYRDLTREERYR